jgi:FAD:protein FMN transferase
MIDESAKQPKTKRRVFLIRCVSLVALCFVAMLSAFGFSEPAKIKLTGSTMGTTYSVVISADSEFNKNEVQVAIDARLDEIDALMSTWRAESELSRFNRSTSTDWFPVAEETQFVVAEALRVAKESDGAFDPTVGPLVRLWNFGAAKQREATPPTDDEIKKTQASIGFAKVEVRRDPPAIRKTLPSVELDLSGIAKGFAVDAISELLVELNFSSHLVEIGGEMKARGKRPDGSAWAIGIERPSELRRELHAALPLEDRAIATSGDYRNYYEVDGKRYSHTIDPTTGKPIAHTLASVSIITDSCMTADAWATGINVLGPTKGLELAKQKGLAVMLLVRADGGFTELSTAEFRALKDNKADVAKPQGLSTFGTIIAALIVFAIAITGMSVGVIFSNRRIQGSCGGLANMPGHEGSACELCTNPSEECQERLAEGDSAVSEQFSV